MKATRYHYTFDFVDTAEQARAEVARLNARATRYIREHKPAHFTPWEARNNEGEVIEKKYIVWYYA